MKTFLALLVVALTFTVTSVTAKAGEISQLWSIDNSSVTEVELFLMTPTVTFETPAITGLPGGMSLSQPNGQYAYMNGGPISSGTYYTININSPVTSFVLDLLEWDGSTLEEQIAYNYNPSDPGSFNDQYGNWYWNVPEQGLIDPSLAGTQYDRSATIPEPATLLMIGAGLIGLVLGARAHRKGIKDLL